MARPYQTDQKDERIMTIKLTRRGKRVRAVFILAAIVAVWLVSTSVWWVGDGYCLGDVAKCMLGER